MDAQKRTILAFVLILAVLFLWTLWSPKAPKERVPAGEEPQARPRDEVVQKGPPPGAAPQAAEVEERELVVETDVLSVVVTNLGLRSVQLKEYQGLGGGWIEEAERLKKVAGEYNQSTADPSAGGEGRNAVAEVNGLVKELRKGYKGIATEDLDGWILKMKELATKIGEAYQGFGGELGERVRRIEELPSWLEDNYRGWVELIPYGDRALSVHLPGVGLEDCPFTTERASFSGGERVTFVYQLPSGRSLTEELTFENGKYEFQLKLTGGESGEMSVGWEGGLAVTEQNRGDDLGYSSAVASLGGRFQKQSLLNLKKMEEMGGWVERGTVHWAGLKTKYFLACLIPADPMKTEGFEARFLPFVPEAAGRRAEAAFGCMPGKAVDGRASMAYSTREGELSVYVGPLDYDILKSMGIGLEKVVDLGWGWISPISRGILALFKGIHKVVPNYGAVIVIFSCLMMVVFFPLTRRSLHQMQEMQKLQPKVEALRKRLKDEPQKMNVEMMKLYRQHGVNPLGGCLPLVFQMPVFFALFSVLRSTIELRRAGFMLWIDDLSTPDTLYLLDFPIHILPILMLVSMMIQQRFTLTDPRQKTMAYMMPIVFTFIFWNFPAGLVLYWLSYNVLSIAQHWFIRRRGRERKEV